MHLKSRGIDVEELRDHSTQDERHRKIQTKFSVGNWPLDRWTGYHR